MNKENKQNIREYVLDAAHEAVCSDRNKAYGEPEDNFSVIANLWSQYIMALPPSLDFDEILKPVDVANMMILFKIGRAVTADVPTLDTYADIAGYAACGGELAERMQKNADDDEA